MDSGHTVQAASAYLRAGTTLENICRTSAEIVCDKDQITREAFIIQSNAIHHLFIFICGRPMPYLSKDTMSNFTDMNGCDIDAIGPNLIQKSPGHVLPCLKIL